jgi:hypothetical protein
MEQLEVWQNPNLRLCPCGVAVSRVDEVNLRSCPVCDAIAGFGLDRASYQRLLERLS